MMKKIILLLVLVLGLFLVGCGETAVDPELGDASLDEQEELEEDGLEEVKAGSIAGQAIVGQEIWSYSLPSEQALLDAGEAPARTRAITKDWHRSRCVSSSGKLYKYGKLRTKRRAYPQSFCDDDNNWQKAEVDPDYTFENRGWTYESENGEWVIPEAGAECEDGTYFTKSYVLPKYQNRMDQGIEPTYGRYGCCAEGQCMRSDGECADAGPSRTSDAYLCVDSQNWEKCTSARSGETMAAGGVTYECGDKEWEEQEIEAVGADVGHVGIDAGVNVDTGLNIDCQPLTRSDCRRKISGDPVDDCGWMPDGCGGQVNCNNQPVAGGWECFNGVECVNNVCIEPVVTWDEPKLVFKEASTGNYYVADLEGIETAPEYVRGKLSLNRNAWADTSYHGITPGPGPYPAVMLHGGASPGQLQGVYAHNVLGWLNDDKKMLVSNPEFKIVSLLNPEHEWIISGRFQSYTTSADKNTFYWVDNQEGGIFVWDLDQPFESRSILVAGNGLGRLKPSPDGQYFAYQSSHGDSYQYHVLNIATGNTVQIYENSDSRSIEWGPNSEWIGLNQVGRYIPRKEQLIMRKDGTDQWSPYDGRNFDVLAMGGDGTYVAFGGLGGIYVYNIDGSDERLVSNDPMAGPLKYSSSGILAYRHRDGNLNLISDTGAPKLETEKEVATNDYLWK